MVSARVTVAICCTAITYRCNTLSRASSLTSSPRPHQSSPCLPDPCHRGTDY